MSSRSKKGRQEEEREGDERDSLGSERELEDWDVGSVIDRSSVSGRFSRESPK